MKGVMEYVAARSGEEWLIGHASGEFTELAWQRYHTLSAAPTPLRILLAERDPIRFLAGFVAACGAGCPVFLGNPDWVAAEWRQVWAVAQPDVVWGDGNILGGAAGNDWGDDWGDEEICRRDGDAMNRRLYGDGGIMVPTGGSSGEIRFAVHCWTTLMAAVEGFRDYFGVDQVNSVCVLPLYHVSGLMQFLRSFTSGGQLVILPFRTLAAGDGPTIAYSNFFLSLVPTQLQRLLVAETAAPSSPHALTRCKAILLGGAPAWADLLDRAQILGLPIAPTYGMTETAAQIATLKPADFLAGKVGCGQILPHAQVKILSPTGDELPAGQIGQITIQAKSLMLGYWPTSQPRSPSPSPHHPITAAPPHFPTDDLGYLDPNGYLHIVGRTSQKIITGGENVFPAEVEAAIRATQLVADVCVVGQPDRQWGQVVTAVYVPTDAIAETTLRAALAPQLSKFKQPKRWLAVTTLPRNAQGKINFAQLEQIIRRNWG